MDTHALGRRGLRQGLIMGVLGARRQPDTNTDRIDVRRGDRPYERVVAVEDPPLDPSPVESDDLPLPDERPDESP